MGRRTPKMRSTHPQPKINKGYMSTKRLKVATEPSKVEKNTIFDKNRHLAVTKSEIYLEIKCKKIFALFFRISQFR